MPHQVLGNGTPAVTTHWLAAKPTAVPTGKETKSGRSRTLPTIFPGSTAINEARPGIGLVLRRRRPGRSRRPFAAQAKDGLEAAGTHWDWVVTRPHAAHGSRAGSSSSTADVVHGVFSILQWWEQKNQSHFRLVGGGRMRNARPSSDAVRQQAKGCASRWLHGTPQA